MKLLFLLLPIVLVTFSGCTDSNTTNNKFLFMPAEFSYEKKDAKYTSQSIYKFNNDTGEAWRMSWKDKQYVWIKIKHIK